MKKFDENRQNLIHNTLRIKFDIYREVKSKNKFRVERKRIDDNFDDEENFDNINITMFSINVILHFSK